jgi:hypothetical protein
MPDLRFQGCQQRRLAGQFQLMQISFMEWAARSSLSMRIDGCLGIGRPGAVGGIGIGASREQAGQGAAMLRPSTHPMTRVTADQQRLKLAGTILVSLRVSAAGA